jgi:DNA-binding NarL/FixJ family response regulator
VKLLIVYDHPIVRAGLRRLLAADPHIEIAEAAMAGRRSAPFGRRDPMS